MIDWAWQGQTISFDDFGGHCFYIKTWEEQNDFFFFNRLEKTLFWEDRLERTRLLWQDFIGQDRFQTKTVFKPRLERTRQLLWQDLGGQDCFHWNTWGDKILFYSTTGEDKDCFHSVAVFRARRFNYKLNTFNTLTQSRSSQTRDWGKHKITSVSYTHLRAHETG